jgi:hypothetical protein
LCSDWLAKKNMESDRLIDKRHRDFWQKVSQTTRWSMQPMPINIWSNLSDNLRWQRIDEYQTTFTRPAHSPVGILLGNRLKAGKEKNGAVPLSASYITITTTTTNLFLRPADQA